MLCPPLEMSLVQTKLTTKECQMRSAVIQAAVKAVYGGHACGAYAIRQHYVRQRLVLITLRKPSQAMHLVSHYVTTPLGPAPIDANFVSLRPCLASDHKMKLSHFTNVASEQLICTSFQYKVEYIFN